MCEEGPAAAAAAAIRNAPIVSFRRLIRNPVHRYFSGASLMEPGVPSLPIATPMGVY
jgi:hypothetical protein